jgi:hypothetical protein
MEMSEKNKQRLLKALNDEFYFHKDGTLTRTEKSLNNPNLCGCGSTKADTKESITHYCFDCKQGLK